MTLAFHFLGSPQLISENLPVSVHRRSVVALLAYLSVEDHGRPSQTHTRESLSALLWPDTEQAKAFTNLRHTLLEIRKVFGRDFLIADRETISFHADSNLWVDVQRFESLLLEGFTQNDVSLRISLLAGSVQLYRHHFLTGFTLKNAPTFSDWSQSKAQGLRLKLTQALIMLADDYCTLGKAESAIPYARRRVELDRLSESAHRQLMQVYLRAGQYSAALKQYQVCEQILRKELNLDPQPETRELYKQIRKGEVKPTQPAVQKQTTIPLITCLIA